MKTATDVPQTYGVLIVEDDAMTRSVMKRVISMAGFRVKEAALASDGFKSVDEDVHLVLVDIGLPDYDGQNLAVRLRRRFSKERLKICFVSSLQGKDSVQKCLDVGGDDYIIKPIDKDILLQKVTKLLGQSTPQFAWVGADCHAEILDSSILPDLKVVRLSESGMLIKSSSRFQAGAHFKLDCPGLTSAIKLPFNEVVHRVKSCERIGHSIFISSDFVGLTEKYVNSLRQLAIRGTIITDAKNLSETKENQDEAQKK